MKTGTPTRGVSRKVLALISVLCFAFPGGTAWAAPTWKRLPTDAEIDAAVQQHLGRVQGLLQYEAVKCHDPALLPRRAEASHVFLHWTVPRTRTSGFISDPAAQRAYTEAINDGRLQEATRIAQAAMASQGDREYYLMWLKWNAAERKFTFVLPTFDPSASFNPAMPMIEAAMEAYPVRSSQEQQRKIDHLFRPVAQGGRGLVRGFPPPTGLGVDLPWTVVVGGVAAVAAAAATMAAKAKLTRTKSPDSPKDDTPEDPEEVLSLLLQVSSESLRLAAGQRTALEISVWAVQASGQARPVPEADITVAATGDLAREVQLQPAQGRGKLLCQIACAHGANANPTQGALRVTASVTGSAPCEKTIPLQVGAPLELEFF